MGTTLASCSHFVTCESLHSMTPGYGYLGWLHFHLFRACAFHRFLLQPIAFRPNLLRLCLPAVPSVFLSVNLPGRSVFKITVQFFSCENDSFCTEQTKPFVFFVLRYTSETLVSSFSRSLTQPSNERPAFFRLTELLRFNSFRPTSDFSVVQIRRFDRSGSLLT